MWLSTLFISLLYPDLKAAARGQWSHNRHVNYGLLAGFPDTKSILPLPKRPFSPSASNSSPHHFLLNLTGSLLLTDLSLFLAWHSKHFTIWHQHRPSMSLLDSPLFTPSLYFKLVAPHSFSVLFTLGCWLPLLECPCHIECLLIFRIE